MAIPLPNPTKNSVPSADIRDAVYAGAMLDKSMTTETEKTYTDRQGKEHKTWYGIEHDATLAMQKYGYITKKSFEKGATLDTPNTVLQLEATGEYYRWDGGWSQPKVVPPGSSPDSTGGIGQGKWVGVGDATVRTWSESNLSPLPVYKVIGKSFQSGGSAIESISALLNINDGYYYTPRSGTIHVTPGSIPDDKWLCLGLLNGFNIEDLRNWGMLIDGQDITTIFNKAYYHLESNLIIPKGRHKVVLIDTYDSVRKETYPIGLKLTKENFNITFEDGAEIYIDPVFNGRYSIIDAYYAHGSSITNPVITGDVGSHTGTDGEWGYGIKVYNCGNFIIHNPLIKKCWGDGILWFNNDTNVSGGAITGKGRYEKCRRQGISVISCNGLTIEDSTGIEISGAPNGPWATIDVEPDVSGEFIVGLEIGNVRGVKNSGPSFLVAVHQLNAQSTPIDISVNNVTSFGCQRCLEVRGDGGVYGLVKISNIVGRNSKFQEMQTVKWLENCLLNIDNFTSINPNQAGDTSSPYGVAIGIYNNYTGGTAGGIKINKLKIINPQTMLTHPIAITNTSGSPVGSYEFTDISYDRARMTFAEIHNPAKGNIITDTFIYREFISNGQLENTRWCNGIRNTSATGTVTVTVPAGYGFDGMIISGWCNSNNQLNIVFSDLFEGRASELRSVEQGKFTARKTLNTWSVDCVPSNKWSQNGTGRYSYGLLEGGATSNRPTNPRPWQTYFDTTLGYEMTYRQDTQAWAKSSG